MTGNEVALAQALSLFAHALTGNEQGYVTQLERLDDAHLVANQLCKMLCQTIAPGDREAWAARLFEIIQIGTTFQPIL